MSMIQENTKVHIFAAQAIKSENQEKSERRFKSVTEYRWLLRSCERREEIWDVLRIPVMPLDEAQR